MSKSNPPSLALRVRLSQGERNASAFALSYRWRLLSLRRHGESESSFSLREKVRMRVLLEIVENGHRAKNSSPCMIT
jgi:hypothetical protein